MGKACGKCHLNLQNVYVSESMKKLDLEACSETVETHILICNFWRRHMKFVMKHYCPFAKLFYYMILD